MIYLTGRNRSQFGDEFGPFFRQSLIGGLRQRHPAILHSQVLVDIAVGASHDHLAFEMVEPGNGRNRIAGISQAAIGYIINRKTWKHVV